MSAFKQGMRKLSVRAGLLAGASAAVLAISGVGATSALAVECGSGTPVNIQGKGSSLQKVAQKELTGREVPGEPIVSLPHTPLTGGGYAAACPTGTTVSYTSTSSGNGLTAFRFNGTGSILNGGSEPEKGFAFIGTDDGPNPAQIKNAEEATSGGVATGANPIIVPVAETSIAVVIHPPTGCKFKTEKGITYADLNHIFGGTILNWSEIANTEGCAASSPITRVVRAEGSGTTFQFKNYLGTLQTEGRGAEMPCSLPGKAGVSTKAWLDMRWIEGATETPNLTWPESSNCTGLTLSPVQRKAGGGAVAEYVAANAGAIGYAALPDAKAKGAATALLQDVAGLTPKFANPGIESGTTKKSNCGERQYSVPSGASGGESVDWSEVFGAKSTVGGELYPLCTLTYDASWSSYAKAGYLSTSASNIASDVKKYLSSYVLTSAGSTLLEKNWYQELPHPATPPTANVKLAAEQAVTKIG